jgi:hypothetical protein
LLRKVEDVVDKVIKELLDVLGVVRLMDLNLETCLSKFLKRKKFKL